MFLFGNGGASQPEGAASPPRDQNAAPDSLTSDTLHRDSSSNGAPPHRDARPPGENGASSTEQPTTASTRDASRLVAPDFSATDSGAADVGVAEVAASTRTYDKTARDDDSRVLPSRLSWLRRRFPRRSNLSLYLAVMGPGLIAALAGNDAGGIGTYSFAGARYGYKMLWLLIVVACVLALVQEMAARMGAVTQKGLGELIREHYGVGWTLFALSVMFIANVATVVAEFAGVAAAGELFGISKYVSVPLAAGIMWLIVTSGPFRIIERVFLAICLVQVTYIVAAFRAVSLEPAGQGWPHIVSQAVRPNFSSDPHFLLLCVGIIGTTITPWMQFFLQSNIVDKGVQVGEYKYQKADVYAGALASNTVSFFIIVCTAATLFVAGNTLDPNTFSAEAAAQALSKPLGDFGKYLFAAGLLAASLLAAAVLPLSTAYTYCEAFGWEIGMQRKFREAPLFYGIFTVTMLLGAVVVLMPNVPLIAAMLISQDVNGALLPIVLVFMLQLINNRRIMGNYVNGRAQNIIAWFLVVAVTLLTLILIGSSIWELFQP